MIDPRYMSMTVYPDPQGDGSMAISADLPGVVGRGASHVAAARDLMDAAEAIAARDAVAEEPT